MTAAQRVIHLIKATGIAGAERHLLDLLPELRARECDARLLVLVEPREPLPGFLDAAHERGVPAESLVIRGDCDVGLWARLVRHFRRERPTIVHTHLIHADFHGIPAARHARVPTVVTTRHDGNDFRRRLPIRIVNRWLWRRVDAGIAASHALQRFSRDVEGARVPIRVIHHGIAAIPPEDPGAVRAALGLARDALVVGIVSRLTEQKGVADGIDAFAAVASSNPQASLLIAGDGPARRSLERHAEALGPRARVRFLGWRTDSRAVIAALDLLIAPSLREGFGLGVLEAMARGVPVLATRVGGIPEIVIDGETGLLVPPADPRALAGGLGRLLADPALRTQLGAAGLDRARGYFSLERMADQTLAVYDEFSRSRHDRERTV
ncbi:MAG: glycosyltransferase [Candidatus Eisenbacteria sp.]|nr:glycosyltransferase [Candidatus Eisenbacteria bacterium]